MMERGKIIVIFSVNSQLRFTLNIVFVHFDLKMLLDVSTSVWFLSDKKINFNTESIISLRNSALILLITYCQKYHLGKAG